MNGGFFDKRKQIPAMASLQNKIGLSVHYSYCYRNYYSKFNCIKVYVLIWNLPALAMYFTPLNGLYFCNTDGMEKQSQRKNFMLILRICEYLDLKHK